MIEDVMLFALGFFGATLAALLVLPLVWARARRVTAQQFEHVLPISMNAVAAERDGLRAEAAVATVQLEQKLNGATQASALAAAELGRRTVDLVTAERARSTLAAELETTAADLDRTRNALAQAQSRCDKLEETVSSTSTRLTAADKAHAELSVERDQLDTLGQSYRTTIAAHEVRIAALNTRLDTLLREVQDGTLEQIRLRKNVVEVTMERDEARTASLRAMEQQTLLQVRLQQENRRWEEQSLRLLARPDASTQTERRAMEHPAEGKELTDLRRGFETLEARLTDSIGDTRPALSDADLADLRSSIVDLGDASVRLLRENENDKRQASAPFTGRPEVAEQPLGKVVLL